MNSAALLDQVRAHIARFATLPSQAALDIATVWTAHTHVRTTEGFLAFDTTPRLAFLSDGPASGKTTAMEAVLRLSYNGEQVIDPTPASYALLISEQHATAGVDETDVLFGAGAAKSTLRSLFNAGYKYGAKWSRANKSPVSVFAPLVMAGIGTKFRTAAILAPLRQRCIMIIMERASQPEAYRGRLHDGITNALRAELTRWARKDAGRITGLWPTDIPDGIENRLLEVCEPLFMVADAAGGHWPASIRKAASEILLGTVADEDEPLCLTDALVADLRIVMGDRRNASTAILASGLRKLPGAPWATLWPQEDSAARELSAMLAPMGIAPQPVRQGAAVVRGFKAADLSLLALTM